jgi:hypothetical protein
MCNSPEFVLSGNWYVGLSGINFCGREPVSSEPEQAPPRVSGVLLAGQEYKDGNSTRHRGGKNQAFMLLQVHGAIMESTDITTRYN